MGQRGNDKRRLSNRDDTLQDAGETMGPKQEKPNKKLVTLIRINQTLLFYRKKSCRQVKKILVESQPNSRIRISES